MTDIQKLQTLLDFSEVRNAKGISTFHISDQIEVSSQNEGILRSFKELRDKLKIIQKQNSELKEELKIKDIKIKQNQQSLETVLLDNIQLKDQLNHQRQTHQQYTKRIHLMKDSLNKFKSVQQQLSFTKNTLLQAKIQSKQMFEEKEKIIELSIREKMSLQENITMFQAKIKSNEEYIGHLQYELANAKENNIKLQNKIRKMSIAYEQQSFTNKWSRQNYQTEYLKETINEKQEAIALLKAKNKKQKQKRAQLEERLIQLEEHSGLNQIKADIFEGETELITKKQNKYQKKLENLQKKIEDKNEQNLMLQQQVARISMLFEQVISSLKNQSYNSLNELIIEFQEKVKSIKNRQLKENGIQNITKRSSEIMKNVFEQQSYCNFSSNNLNFNKYSSNKVNDLKSQTMPYNSSTTYTTGRFTFGHQKQNQSPEISVVQNKIRRERDQMEKKIKQKYFQKKIEASLPSQLHKLRGQYIRTFIDKL